MNELSTDLWAMLLPEEWQAEQEDDIVVISDDDEVSVIEISSLVPEQGVSSADLLQSLIDGNMHKTSVAELDAYYQEIEEEGEFWREWYCDAETFVLVVSHGCDIDNKSMDDSTVDEILSTIVLCK